MRLDELEAIRKKKLERMMKEMTESALPKVEYPDYPVVVTDSSLDAAASQYPLLVVDCWAEWCGPCRSVAPIIDDMARELKGRAVFCKLNVDQNMQTANKYRISAIPTFLLFKNGQLIDRIIGAYPKAAFMKKIQKYL